MHNEHNYQQAQQACEQFQEALEQLFDGRVIVAWNVIDCPEKKVSQSYMAGGYKMTNTGRDEYDVEDCQLTLAMISMLTKAFMSLEESQN